MAACRLHINGNLSRLMVTQKFCRCNRALQLLLPCERACDTMYVYLMNYSDNVKC